MYFGNGSVITFKCLITVVWILKTVKMLLFYVNLSKKQQGNLKKNIYLRSMFSTMIARVTILLCVILSAA